MNPLRAMIVIGSRTEAIRLAPLVQECRRRDTIEPTVCLAGQRRDSIGQVIDYFGVEADVDLPVGPPHLSVAEATARCLTGIDQALARYRPDCLIAHGQAGIGAAAALAAVYRGIPFVNVAGYRQRENAADTMHRRLLTHAATLHCAPTARERDELLAEGLAPADVLATGDTAADGLLWSVRQERTRDEHWFSQYPALRDRPLVLVTDRCRGDFEKGLAEVCRAVLILATEFPDIEFVLPVDRNPRVREIAERSLGRYADDNVHLRGPLPYNEFAWLMDRSALIVTDSAAVRAEAPALGKPVLVTRAFGGQPQISETGNEDGRSEQWVGVEARRIIDRAELLLTDAAAASGRPTDVTQPAGRAVERTIEFILGRIEPSSTSVPLRIAA
jgi:UDP-N-acetylglucosamine 2-epimerase (non-hydrolysing)